ncbi:hypothetical protein CHR60_12955 [Faecalibacterium prausnitzii]|uniref:histidine kinase n=1 Tax=Faecalibacterium prausnitzii TaxID=853 RepID=A0A2A7B3R4_9FIRM|nr:ATP-binding protein [Faecalibacterium prausnitzii]PDX85922.1 hypothetical protein CHR60_12955 [Faecalibacterium prausnitzii]
MCRQDEAGFPQKQLETAFLHSLRLLEQNREYLQMHLQPLKDARAAQALEDMEQEAARLERTFRELMELSAPEKPVQKRPVDLCRLLAQLEGLRGEIDAQSSTKLTVDCGGLEQCLVWGDREMAEQICFHLLSNALRAAAPGGNIQVCLRQTGQDIRLTIEDDGCGLPEGESWLENRRRFLGGAQAGLLLCRRYCRQLGWALALLPRTPQGVRAELTLPLPTRPFPIETTVEFRSQPSHPDEHSTTALQHQLRRELYLLTRRHAGN